MSRILIHVLMQTWTVIIKYKKIIFIPHYYFNWYVKYIIMKYTQKACFNINCMDYRYNNFVFYSCLYIEYYSGSNDLHRPVWDSVISLNVFFIVFPGVEWSYKGELSKEGGISCKNWLCVWYFLQHSTLFSIYMLFKRKLILVLVFQKHKYVMLFFTKFFNAKIYMQAAHPSRFVQSRNTHEETNKKI